jgi:hypothetical protein
MAAPSISPDSQPDSESARAAINRENARHSTGPRTAEGKQRVRLNALKHGLYSKTILVPDAEKAAYEHDAELLVARYHPVGDIEIELVQTLHEYRWRFSCAVATEQNLRRLTEDQQLESIDQRFGEQDEDSRRALAQAAAFQANSRLFDQLSRHISRLEKMIDRTQRELVFVITRRAEQEHRRTMTEQSQRTRAEAPESSPQMPEFTGSLKDFKRKQWLRQQEKRNNPQGAA